MTEPGLLIIGGGEAGGNAARAIREGGWTGPLTLLGEEAHAPYERPPLSKAALVGEADPSPLDVIAPVQFSELRIDLIAGAEVIGIDRHAKLASTRSHGAFAYERLILATGARARTLSCEGGEHALTLRTFEDACTLRHRLKAGKRLVIIGAGFVGLEVAASARNLGLAVTLLEAAQRILGRAVPEDIARRLAERHAREGVEAIVGQTPRRISRRADDYAVETSDGRVFEADLVVAGIGSAPRTELAAAAGLVLDNGVAVNGGLRTSDPDIFAIGDCCSFPHPLYAGKRLRLESWRNAGDQARFVASGLFGETREYREVPWFWSDQYDLHLQIVGLPSEGSHVVRRDLGGGATIEFHLAPDGRLVAASALGSIDGVGRECRLAEKLIAAQVAPAPEALASPKVKLKALLAA